MDISQSLDSALQPQTDFRDRLYYDQYQWCVCFPHDGASILRPADGPDFDSYLELVIKRWNWRTASKFPGPHKHRVIANSGGSWRVENNDTVSSQRLDSIIKLAKLLWRRSDTKVITYYAWVYVYCNDPVPILQDLQAVTQDITVKKAVVNRPKNTIIRRDPQHTIRSYLRSKKITDQQKTSLATLLRNQSDITISRTLKDWLALAGKNQYWAYDYFWFDHDNQGLELMLEMIVPGVIGRSHQIIAVNNKSKIED